MDTMVYKQIQEFNRLCALLEKMLEMRPHNAAIAAQNATWLK